LNISIPNLLKIDYLSYTPISNKAMKNKKLQVLLIFLLFGCTPGIEKIYKQVQVSGSGFVYFYNIQSIQDELNVLQNVLDSLDKKIDPSLYNLIENQILTTKEFQSSLNEYINDTIANFKSSESSNYLSMNSITSINDKPSKLDTMALPPQCRKPYPCPQADSSYTFDARYFCFFTRNPRSKVEIFKNGQLLSVLEKGSFNKLTKVRTICVPRNLALKKGDSILLKLHVEYFDSAKKLQSIVIGYKEIIQ
jgi:hypothetical protein